MDVDLLADWDPATGAPSYNDQSRARRWLDALDEGPIPEFSIATQEETDHE